MLLDFGSVGIGGEAAETSGHKKRGAWPRFVVSGCGGSVRQRSGSSAAQGVGHQGSQTDGDDVPERPAVLFAQCFFAHVDHLYGLACWLSRVGGFDGTGSVLGISVSGSRLRRPTLWKMGEAE